ncbi:DEAD/DEAH box helicase family protein [Butyrivibrio sp. NC2007]|uniref:DEAD/DEAH box helicase family protein n=1 Tax=Butyrivibrio sp. NC2007 TaxID=1280683 RepID=UPI0003B31755|nr:DEAD/DEAH box helicase family protein [Butyrivibrio sp. NC2007]
MYLYQQLETLREYGSIASVPQFISTNLSPRFVLRPYQVKAFENFITYFENDRMRRNPAQTLFHMATGSGKTLVMAGLMLYLYSKGYRNFLFFVNLSNIVGKTRNNFVNPCSKKYLFADEICIDGERIPIRVVNNFQNTDEAAINICFTTTQGLHQAIWITRENSLSLDDFDDTKVVLIADEAHHLNVDLQHASQDEKDEYRSWEYTVKSIFEKNRDNVLLEFTATCDLENDNIRSEYENKIVMDYQLSQFRDDGYSKEIKTLRTDLSVEERALQAIILSQYRYKVFQSHRLNVKPVILFKSKLIRDNAGNMERIIAMIQGLTPNAISDIFAHATSEIMGKAHQFFVSNGITFDDLVTELRDDFSEEHCISANDNMDEDRKQIILNSLEDKTNPYRAVFAVDKLNEGWDVLNLFDIVRLYDTRDGRNGAPGKTTIKEAQLIGRGARYCPFTIDEEQDKFKRKYDQDIDNPLRICETLYYHCWNEPRYISELHTALRGIGLDIEGIVEREYVLKQEFKENDLYTEGIVFSNKRVAKNRENVNSLLPSIRDRVYSVRMETGQAGEDIILDEGASTDNRVQTYTVHTTIKEISDINYSIVHKAMCQYPLLKFNVLQTYFPNLKSTREFITDSNYLGNIRIDLTSRYDEPSPVILYKSCLNVLGKIVSAISGMQEEYEGTKEFYAENIRDVFKNKKCSVKPIRGSIGYSQNDSTVDGNIRLDLSQEDWYAFEDNFGTSEEKAFVAYFKDFVPQLKEKYDKVYLVRNERQMHLYSFSGGERFEPDYVLFLHRNSTDGYEQLQIFIEPKGTHLVTNDKWKEDFLLDIEENAIPVKKFVDDNRYLIWGFHFFNRDVRFSEFASDMIKLI